jgi:hypothetical protein
MRHIIKVALRIRLVEVDRRWSVIRLPYHPSVAIRSRRTRSPCGWPIIDLVALVGIRARPLTKRQL